MPALPGVGAVAVTCDCDGDCCDGDCYVGVGVREMFLVLFWVHVWLCAMRRLGGVFGRSA